MSHVSYDKDILPTLISQFQAIINSDITKIDVSYEIECLLQRTLILWRNGEENLISNRDKYDMKGLFFKRPVNPKELQLRYASMYNDIFKVNNYGVPTEIITKHDDVILSIINDELNKPLWWSLSDEDLHQSVLPEYKLQRYDEYISNLNFSLDKDVNDTTRVTWLSDMEKDVTIELHNDLTPSGKKPVSKSRYISDRQSTEMDPHYVYHPIQALFLTILMIRATSAFGSEKVSADNPTFYSYGLRYMELLCNTIARGNNLYRTFPVIFSTEGKIVGTRLYSHYPIKLRIILNDLTYLLTYKDIHNYSRKYMDINDEVLLYMLQYPNKGRELKKTVTRLNLYYGLRFNAKTTDTGKTVNGVSYIHDHPIHKAANFTQPVLAAVNEFTSVSRCYEHESKILNKAVFSPTVKRYVFEDILSVKETGLPVLAKFCETLVDMRVNSTIITDIVFLRTLLNFGGYSRSNQITDFKATIDDITVMNEKFLSNSDPAKSINSLLEWMGPKMTDCGYGLTKAIIEGEISTASYPSANQAKTNIDTYITSRSAGIGNIKLIVNTGKKVYKTRSTSKSTFANVIGSKIFDVNDVSTVPIMFSEFLSNLSQTERDKFIEQYDQGKITPSEVMRICGQNVIGSRSTTAWRPVRPIYINVLQAHLAQSFIIGPHIDATTRQRRDRPTGLWFTGKELGIGFATLYQNGTSDMIAPAIEASSTGKALSVLADCSSWDQTYLTATIIPYYEGIKKALAAHGIASQINFYMIDSSRRDVQGMTILETIDWFNKFQEKRIFNASYLGELYSFVVKYMWSGRLDTFLMNSVQNGLITEKIAGDVFNQVNNIPLTWYQVAGDDAIMVYDASSITHFGQVDSIRNITVKNYEQANHIINPQKTVVSHISGEYAKIYYYAGMHFRDPSIQLHESEKDSNASDIIERLRGFSQVCFEYNKRAIGSLRVNSLYARLLAGLAYTIVVRKPSRSSSQVKDADNITPSKTSGPHDTYKYFPPPGAIITPSAYSGGLGMTYTGISLNEVLFIRLHLSKIVETGLSTVSTINFSANETLANALTKHFLKEKPEILKDLRLPVGTESIKSISYKSSDSVFSGGDFAQGLNMKRESLDATKVRISRQASDALGSIRVKLPNSLLYENIPYSALHQSFKQLAVDKDVARLTSESTLFRLLEDESDTPRMKITSSYPVYDLFVISAIKSRNVESSGPIRYISTPTEGKMLESTIGSRTGIQFRNKGYAGSQEIVRFIRQNGLIITEAQLIALVIKSGVLNSYNPKKTMTDLFEALSGDPSTSSVLADFFIEEKPHWEDNAISVTIIGSLLENCDSRLENISNFVGVPAINMERDITRMFKYIGYVYFAQRFILNNYNPDYINVQIKDEDLRLFLKSSKPVTNSKRNKSAQGKSHNPAMDEVANTTEPGFHVTYVTNVNDSEADNLLDTLALVHPLAIPFLGNQIEKYAVTQSEI
ncbi:RNA-directed RNA polymerase [Homalodisca vitripennis reovirus]|uniref:RNA-directed RNA polymerase n=1 Tax=Homalodisca vitripennis reovirus TaxID=411854 RepID=UPI00019977EC|nr:RNA-directed RNA polymerase [Homalodisca vitripennis reovirus]ACO37232.1 RNA-directed RNA polymerase [Homalodisca vitripennis reovirus]ADN64810.1 RNA-directed RNA polymerase [Homalodisca vitripennis reovirus]ADN64813.1 RNA-directed RNA polymerase [Homalodisca vitripennis reovirus]